MIFKKPLFISCSISLIFITLNKLISYNEEIKKINNDIYNRERINRIEKFIQDE